MVDSESLNTNKIMGKDRYAPKKLKQNNTRNNNHNITCEDEDQLLTDKVKLNEYLRSINKTEELSSLQPNKKSFTRMPSHAKLFLRNESVKKKQKTPTNHQTFNLCKGIFMP